MPMKSQTRRALLLAFVAAIVCCSLAGIYCLLVGQMGSFQERVLGTTAAVAAASILAMAAAISWERRRWHPIGFLSLSAVAAALALLLMVIWLDLSETIAQAAAVAWVAGVALTQVSLLALARLRRGYEWTRVVTIIVIVLLAGQIVLSTLTEVGEEGWYRVMGVLVIVNICGSLAVAILHRVSGIRQHEEIHTSALVVSLTCPRCSGAQRLPVGRSKCAACGLRFRIEIEEEHCPSCGYALYRLESAVCPECGTPVARPTATERALCS